MRTAGLLRPTWALLVTLAACASGAKSGVDASDTAAPGTGGASGGSGGKGGAWPEDPDGPPGGWAGGTAGSSTGGTGGAGTGGSSAGGSGGTFTGTGGTWAGGGFSGTSGSGDAGVDAPPAVGSDNCASAPQIKLEGSGRIRLRANTTTAARDMDPPCAAGSGGPDVFFRLAVDRRSLVYVDTFGSNANTVVFFTSTCSGGTMAGGAQSCSDDACGLPQSQAVADLSNGAHYLVVSGKAGATFDTMINLEYTVVSNTAVHPLPAGPSTLTGTTMGVGNIYACEASGPETSYWWLTCPSFTEMPMMSSTCTGTAFDTVLSLQVPRAGGVACGNDNCGFQAALTAPVPAGAGLNVLSVTGPTLQSKGAFTLQVVRP